MQKATSACLVLAATLAMCGFAIAQQSRVVSEKGKDRFGMQLAPGSNLKLNIRSGDVRISGTDSKEVSVRFAGRRAGEVEDVRFEFRQSADGGTLKISGGPRNEFAICIEVPRETDLFVRMPFGELKLDEIHGNKNIELHAGELNIAMGNPHEYARIEASVYTGEINSAALSLSKGGLFRSYEKDGPGKYKLYAHVGSGELNLN
jgi:hypothetical protein